MRLDRPVMSPDGFMSTLEQLQRRRTDGYAMDRTTAQPIKAATRQRGRLMQTTRKLTNDITLGFDWQGGPYIEVCQNQAFSSPKEVINVWNYETDASRIPFTKESFRSAVDEWIGEYPRQDLIHDVRENWRYY